MFDTYIADEFDNIETIAKKFNINKKVLESINDDNLVIQKGTNVLIPKIKNKYFDYYVIKKGDTLSEIAKENLLNPQLLATLNGINIDDYIYPNQVLIIPKAGSIIYITTEGDTLDELALGLKTTTDELIKQNTKIYLQPEQLIVYNKQ